MSHEDKMDKRQQTHEKGYVSFTGQDLNEAQSNCQANALAYTLLDEAMHTSSHITERDRNGETCDLDNIYPCTAAECDAMDNLLNRAEQAADDKEDKVFNDYLRELRLIVSWSRQKHWTFKWSLILGCVLSVFGMMYLRNDAESDLEKRKQEKAIVENWTEQEADAHKAQKLASLESNINTHKKLVDEYAFRIDTCSDRERRRSYESYRESYENSLKKEQQDYKDISRSSFKQYRKMILEEKEQSTDNAGKHAFWMWFFFIYAIILIPAYIYSSHQYGYNITRHREESAALSGIQKTGFAIAGFFLGSGLAMALLPDYEVTYGDGHKEIEPDTGNIVIYVMKLILILIGLIIFCLVSVFIMTYVTIMAAKRNHDWSGVASAASSLTLKAADKIKESGIKDKAVDMARKAADKVQEKLDK